MNKKLFFIFLTVFLLLFIVGCAKKECEKSSDCLEKACSTASCVKNICEYNVKASCCGNGLKDKIEDGKTGNKCTCPKDYGQCDRKNGTYFQEYCTASNECVFGVSSDKIQRPKFLNEKSTGYFKVEVSTEYDIPFIVNKSRFTATITLKDDSEKLVYPIKFTSFRLMEGYLVLGEISTNLKLNKIGDTISVDVPFTYITKKSEEQKTVILRAEYEHKYKITNGEDIERKYFDVSYKDKLILLNSGLVK
jgi:hypothetical protein